MSGICGSIGFTVLDDRRNETLEAMAGGLVLTAATEHSCFAGSGRDIAAAASAWADAHPERDVWAVIEGRPHWRDPDLRDIAEQEGHAKALIAAYQQHGREALTKIEGSWAAAIIDKAADYALVAVDRVGLRPLCYGVVDGEGLVFGTTVDCIRAHPAIEDSLNFQSIYELIYFTRIPAPRTIYDSIAKLGPGQAVEYQNGRASLIRYWKLDYTTKARPDADALANELRQLVWQAVERCIDGENPEEVGAFLSGGVDSTTVTGVLADLSDHSPKAFTVGFDVAGYDETEFAVAAADHYGVDHHSCYVSPGDIIDFLPQMARLYDEPYANASAVPAYYCAKQAHESGIRVMLAGDGGDELFAGNERYISHRVFDHYSRIPGVLRKFMVEPIASLLPEAGPELLRKAKSYVRRANIPLPDRLESYNHISDIAIEDCFVENIAARIDMDAALDSMRGHYHTPENASTLDRMMFLDMQTTIADDDIRKVNRTAEANGVDVRYPLLDDDVVAFSARLPESLQLKGGELRWFFKYAMRDFLPQSTLTKSKHGFGLPFDLWIRTDSDLQEFSYGKLAELCRRGFFRQDFVEETIAAHRRNDTHSHGQLVWAMLLFELWLENHEEVGQAATPAYNGRSR